MVAMIAWQLTVNLNARGAKLDLAKVLEFALVHDLGELFGGDISMLYARANPIAKTAAKQFESHNQKFISKFFGPQQDNAKELMQEVLAADSDECIIAKVADYLEVTHYKHFISCYNGPVDISLVSRKLADAIDKIKDQVAATGLREFISIWISKMATIVPFNEAITEWLFTYSDR